MKLAAAVVLVVACGGSDGDDVDGRPAALAPTDPERETRAIFGLLGRIERAVLDRDPTILDGSFASTYVEVACGEAHGRDRATAARSRIERGRNNGWNVTLSIDGAMAWAISTDDAPIQLEVLAREPSGWKLVAGAISADDPDRAGCRLPSAPVVTVDAPATPPSEPQFADGAPRVWCGRNPDLGERGNLQRMTLELDVDEDGVYDFAQNLGAPRPSQGGGMAWRIGGRGTARTLSVLEHRRAGWQTAAAVWSADVDTTARCTTALEPRGRVVVTDSSVEILDRIRFRRDSAELAPASYPILDAIAATLTNNPDIARVALRVTTEPTEADAWALSEQRGLVVRAYVVSKGVAIERIEIEFAGAAPTVAQAGVEWVILERR